MSKKLFDRYEMRLSYLGNDKLIVKHHYRRIWDPYGGWPK